MKCIYIEPATQLSLYIDDSLITTITEIARQHYPKEIGGFFIGKYIEENRRAIILELKMPEDFSNGNTHFYRDTKGLNKYLAELKSSNIEMLYLGEWHSHPNGAAIPSNTDKNMMIKISSSKSSVIQNPILGIISISKQKSDLRFYVVHNNELLNYACVNC